LPFFDRQQTMSGVGRGEQRRLYDARKREPVPLNGLKLVVVPKSEFALKSKLAPGPVYNFSCGSIHKFSCG